MHDRSNEQTMKPFPTGQQKHLELIPVSSLFCFLLLLFTSCGTGGTPGPAIPSSTASGTLVTNNTPTLAPEMLTPTPGVVLGVQPCPSAVRDSSYWATVIHPTNGDHVETISCANLMGTPTLQALVTVRCECSGAFLDVYVYNNLTSSTPTRIFQLQHLERADARISGYNTVLTGETDETSSINKHARGNASLMQDLYREFAWSSTTGTFVPIAFPGLFPDLTRFQAEVDQAQVDQGHQPWKLSPMMTAQALAASLLKWAPNAPATLLNGGGATDVKAEVAVKSPSPGGGTIKATLYRLEGNSTHGIWEITAVTTDNAAIIAPTAQALITPPVTVQGTGKAFEGKIGTVIVFDHTYTDIGQADAAGTSGNGTATFSATIPYISTVTSGTISRSTTEEGIIALYTSNNADGSIATAVLVKVLLHG